MTTPGLTIEELLPKGQARMSNGEIWQRKRWDGPNYDYRTPCEHDDLSRMGLKRDLYPPTKRSEYSDNKEEI